MIWYEKNKIENSIPEFILGYPRHITGRWISGREISDRRGESKALDNLGSAYHHILAKLIVFLSFIPVIGYILLVAALMTGLGGFAQTFKFKKL